MSLSYTVSETLVVIYQSLKRSCDPKHNLVGVIYHTYASTHHSQSTQQTEMPSFTYSKDMVTDQEFD